MAAPTADPVGLRPRPRRSRRPGRPLGRVRGPARRGDRRRGAALPRASPRAPCGGSRCRRSRCSAPLAARPRRRGPGSATARPVRAGLPAAAAGLDRHPTSARCRGWRCRRSRRCSSGLGGRRDGRGVAAAAPRRSGRPRCGSPARRCAAGCRSAGSRGAGSASASPTARCCPLAAVGGEPLLSFVTVLAGLALGELVRRRRGPAAETPARRRARAARLVLRWRPARWPRWCRRRGRRPAARSRSPPCRATCRAWAWTSTPSAARCSTTTCGSPSSSPPTSPPAAGRSRTW